MYGQPILESLQRLGIGRYSDPVPSPYCGSCISPCTTPARVCAAPEPRCATICSIDGVALEDCAKIKFCQDTLVNLSFDGCDNTICADLDLCGLVLKNIVRAGTGIKVKKQTGAFGDCYYEISSALKHSINGVQFANNYNQDPNWFNLCLTSSDNSIEISQIASDNCNGAYALDLRSNATGLGTSLIFKDLAALADFGCEVSNPGGPVTIVIDGFDVQCTSNSEVRLKRKFGSLGSVNNVKNNGGNIDLISSDKSVNITPNDSANTIDLKVAIRSTEPNKLSISRDTDGTFVLDPSGGDVSTDWQNFTPEVTASTTNPPFGAGSGATSKGQYKVNLEKEVHAMYELTFGADAGSGSYSVSLPLPTASDAVIAVGTLVFVDNDTSARKLGWVEAAPNDTKLVLYAADGTRLAHNAPITFAQGDKLIINILYKSN